MASHIAARSVQYDAKTDVIVYGDPTADFTREDWIRLAIAALDQAGAGDDLQREVRSYFEPETAA